MTSPMTPPQDQECTLLPRSSKSHITHGHTVNRKYSLVYHSWQAMLGRCRYKNRDTQNKYVNRGITVCAEWQSFENFLRDMGERPAGTTLERTNNSLGYYKENCCWASPIEQARNRRNKRLDYETALIIARRMLAGAKATELAKEYGISESLPREIHKGRTWMDAHDAARQ